MPKFLLILAVLLGTATMASGQALHDAHSNAGVPCTACHQEMPPTESVPSTTCVGCHGTMIEPLQGTPPTAFDPHRSPHLGPGEVPVCTECHKVHRPSEVTCAMCHRGIGFEIK